jgi:hypothetical protein
MTENAETEAVKEAQEASATETDRSIRDVVRELVSELQDNEVISIPLEGMVIENGQETE